MNAHIYTQLPSNLRAFEDAKETLLEYYDDHIIDYGIRNHPEYFPTKDTVEVDAENYLEQLSLTEVVRILDELDLSPYASQII